MGVIAIAILGGMPAMAHGELEPGDSGWAAWNLTLETTLGILVVAVIYSAGIWRRRNRTGRTRIWRHVSFFVGLFSIFLALQSPIDAIAERVFLMHQVQHLLLRMIGPILLFLAVPQGVLVAGMPALARRYFLVPIITNPIVNGISEFLAKPTAATVMFIGVLYFWQIPRYHDLAVLDENVHYLMHVSMLLAGLIFFWRVFDARPPPRGTRYGIRLMMLWIMILSNIVIGSYLAFKQPVLYSAYSEFGRFWGLSALADELLGGALIWIPSSMMGVVAALIVVHMWGGHETKIEQSREMMQLRRGFGRIERPMTAADLIRSASRKNRAMAFGFAVFVCVIFVAVIAAGFLNQMMRS